MEKMVLFDTLPADRTYPLLHDVDNHKLSPETHADKGRAVDFLNKHGVSREIINTICDIIDTVSFRGTDSVIPESIEGKCVQDADRLDANEVDDQHTHFEMFKL